MSNIAPDHNDVLVTPPLTPFAVVPVAVIREQQISDAAFRLYAALDGRITQTKSLRLRQDTLAADLGWSVSKVKRCMGELVAAGLVGSLRTSRSSRINVLNPVRRTVDNLPADRSDLSEQEARSVNSDPADRSDLTPPYINNSLINNNNIAAGQTPTPTATGFSTENPIGGYLEAIAEAGVQLSATKTIQRFLGKIKVQGVTPAELTELVRCYLATGVNIADPVPYVAGYVLAELAAGRRPPKSAPKQMSPTELANARRCDHGAITGQCALCRAASTAEQIKRIFAEVVPAAVFEHNQVFDPAEHDYHDEPGEEISFIYHGALIWISLNDINGRKISRIGINEQDGAYAPAGADPDMSYLFNIWEWENRLTQRYSATEVKHGESTVEDLRIEYRKPIDLATFTADLKWVVQQLDEITQPASTHWDCIAGVIPAGWQIKPNGSVAEVVRHGETVAHISVKDPTDKWSKVIGLTLFTDYDRPSQGRNDWVLATTRTCFKGDLDKWQVDVTPVAVNGELVITLEPTRREGLTNDNMLIAFQSLLQTERRINATDEWLNSLLKTA
jgi:hypothetical protein